MHKNNRQGWQNLFTNVVIGLGHDYPPQYVHLEIYNQIAL